jgi:hypothetical protein
MRAVTRHLVPRRVAAIVAGTGMLLAAGGCATTDSSARYNRDEPAQRLASMVDGTVTRVDEPQQVVVLDDGRMYRVSGDRAVLTDGRPVVLGQLQPGSRVTIESGTPVVYQNGQYVAVAPGTGTVLTVPPGTVVAAPPAGTVITAPSGSVVRMHGRVSDVENNGNVKVRLPDGNAFEFRPPAGAVARKGDAVTIDMTFGSPPPSALPR